MDMKYHPAHLWKRVVSLLSAAALALCLVAPARRRYRPEELPPFSYTPDPTVNIIFDTDIDSDVDDAGAMALLHSYVQQGKVNLLAVVGCCNSGYAAPCIDAINTYYGLPDVPVGIAPTLYVYLLFPLSAVHCPDLRQRHQQRLLCPLRPGGVPPHPGRCG